jgi:5-formyltetrahydrofolate cyclo-ligase
MERETLEKDAKQALKLEKRALRKELRRRIAALDEKELEKSDEAIYNNLSVLPELLSARRVFLYLSVGHEVDTRRLIRFLLERGAVAALPVSLPHGEMYFAEYRPGGLRDGTVIDIPEPDASAPAAEPEDGDLMLVPALCFDREGYRMGQGGGYYDRYLSARDLFSVGVGRDMLLCDRVIREEHDRPVDCLVTESGVYRFAGKEKTGE